MSDNTWANPNFWYRTPDGFLLLVIMAACSFVLFRLAVSGKLSFIAPVFQRREAGNTDWAMLFLVFINLATALAYYA